MKPVHEDMREIRTSYENLGGAGQTVEQDVSEVSGELLAMVKMAKDRRKKDILSWLLDCDLDPKLKPTAPGQS